MNAIPGRTYAQILQGRLHRLFTSADLPEWSDVTEPPETHTVFTIQAVDVTGTNPQEGWLWNGSSFVPPPDPEPVVPQSVSRFQAKAALLQAGLLGQVESMMASPATSEVARLAWKEALEFRRDSPTLEMLALLIGLTSKQLDDLFIAAAGITA